MPISHKIRQYRALLGFAHPGEVLRSTEQAEEVMPNSHKIRQYRALLGFARQGEVPGSAERPGKSRPSRECGAVLCTKFWLALSLGARDWSL